MSRNPTQAASLALLMVALAACHESSGPGAPVGRLAIEPDFGLAGGTAAAGIVDIARTRIRLARTDGGTALDTVVTVEAGADSVVLVAQVPITSADEEFTLTVAFITPAGDTAFYGGPITVQISSSAGAPVPVTLPVTYVGVGANAAGVRITTPAAILGPNDSADFAAEAFDSAGQVIPNTPIAWSSLDPTLATVPDPAVGRVVSASANGQARIVAALLTGPSDTATAFVGSQGGSGNILVLSNSYASNAAIRDSFPPYMPQFAFDTMEVSQQTPTLALLSQYRLVLVYEDPTFPNSANVGDSVAAYYLAGGNVVIGTFYWQNRSDNPLYSRYGWGALENHDPFLAPEGSEYRADSLHIASMVAHPMTAGITRLRVDSYHGGVIAKPGTTVLAWWTDACGRCAPDTRTPALAYRAGGAGQRFVGVSMYPGYPYYQGYSGDFYRLWANVFSWAIAGGSGNAAAAPATAGTALRSHPVGAPAGVGVTRGGPRGSR